MIIVIPNKCIIFAELNEANHNKDYSGVKTFKAGLIASPFLCLLFNVSDDTVGISVPFRP